MGRPGISKADVVRAYVALLKQRREPSLQNLRLELGRGSYSTIAAHVASLAIASQGVRQQSTPRDGRPAPATWRAGSRALAKH